MGKRRGSSATGWANGDLLRHEAAQTGQQQQQQQQHEIVRGSTNAAAELIGAVAPRPGHGLAYVDSLGVIERVRFTDVARRTAEWAELVREHGVQPGDRVIVLAGRDREWRFALLGVTMAGGVAVPFPASTPARELQAIASDANAVLFVSARARLDLAAPDGPRALSSDDLERRHKALAAQHVPHLAMPADVALIVSDHGPDGLRGAVHTHASLADGAEVAERWLGVRAGDRLWSTVANGSIESIWLLLGAWRVGGRDRGRRSSVRPRGRARVARQVPAGDDLVLRRGVRRPCRREGIRMDRAWIDPVRGDEP